MLSEQCQIRICMARFVVSWYFHVEGVRTSLIVLSSHIKKTFRDLINIPHSKKQSRFHILWSCLQPSNFWYSRVDRRDLTSSPPQNRTWTSRFIRLLPAIPLKPLGFKPTQKAISSSHFWLAESFCELTQTLRSSSITEPSSLLRVVPPLCLASVLSHLWGLHLRFSLNIETTGSRVPHKSLDQVHAISMPDTAQPINRLPLDLSWSCLSTPVLTSSQIFRHLIDGSGSLISLVLTWSLLRGPFP